MQSGRHSEVVGGPKTFFSRPRRHERKVTFASACRSRSSSETVQRSRRQTDGSTAGHTCVYAAWGFAELVMWRLLQLPGPLNVSHRSKWEEVAAKTILAVISVEAAQPDQQALLDEYIAYFSSKERVGSASFWLGLFFALLGYPGRSRSALPAHVQIALAVLLQCPRMCYLSARSVREKAEPTTSCSM